MITFQVGEVDPLFSVSYRFALAGLLMIVICSIMKLKMKFTRKEHAFILLQGLLLFGFNYWLMYMSELYLTSGVVGLIFSLLVFFNIINSRMILKTPFEKKVIIGGILGIIGTAFIFQEDLSHFTFSDTKIMGLLMAIGGTIIASFGNITSARNQAAGIPVIQSNAFGMFYGAVVMFLVAIVQGKTPTFELTLDYTLSLAYLTIFGSIIAFGSYLTLVGNIGASKAAYVSLVIPIIALTISTFLEGYTWTIISFSGAALIIVGNVIALRLSRKRKVAEAVE